MRALPPGSESALLPDTSGESEAVKFDLSLEYAFFLQRIIAFITRAAIFVVAESDAQQKISYLDSYLSGLDELAIHLKSIARDISPRTLELFTAKDEKGTSLKRQNGEDMKGIDSALSEFRSLVTSYKVKTSQGLSPDINGVMEKGRAIFESLLFVRQKLGAGMTRREKGLEDDPDFKMMSAIMGGQKNGNA